MVSLTERQKQLLAGGLVLALGIATGVVITPDDSERDTKLLELGSTIGSALNDEIPIDTDEYNRAILAVRIGRNDIFDVLTPPVEPGAEVETRANVTRVGVRPTGIEFVGAAVGRFTIDTEVCPRCGVFFEDRPQDGVTTIRVVAMNTSPDVVRLTAFVHCGPECLTPGGP